jgi:hypothetical protein
MLSSTAIRILFYTGMAELVGLKIFNRDLAVDRFAFILNPAKIISVIRDHGLIRNDFIYISNTAYPIL